MWRWHGPSARRVGREEARPEGRCPRLRGRGLARRARSCCRSELSPLLHRALPSRPRLLAAFSPAQYCPPGDPGLRWVETVMSDIRECPRVRVTGLSPRRTCHLHVMKLIIRGPTRELPRPSGPVRAADREPRNQGPGVQALSAACPLGGLGQPTFRLRRPCNGPSRGGFSSAAVLRVT